MNVHRIEIIKNLNQVPICTLTVTGIDEVNIGQRIFISAVSHGIDFPTFSGIVIEKETNPYNKGKVTLGHSMLSKHRDDETITASVVWFEPKLKGNVIDAELKYGNSPIRGLTFSAEREINFANASKLQIMQQYCEEHGQYFDEDDAIKNYDHGGGNLFTFSRVGNYRLTQKRKTGIGETESPVTYQVNCLRQYPQLNSWQDIETSTQELSNWIGESYTATVITKTEYINGVVTYILTTYSPTEGGPVRDELIKQVSAYEDGYKLETKITSEYNKLTDGILNEVDFLTHYDNDQEKWLDYITFLENELIYDGTKQTLGEQSIAFDQTDKNGEFLEEFEYYYAKVFLNYRTGQIYVIKGEKGESALFITGYFDSWEIATVKVNYAAGGSEISESDVEIGSYLIGGQEDRCYKYDITVELCDSATRVYKRTNTIVDDGKLIYKKEETWQEETYNMREWREDKNDRLVLSNQATRGYSAMPTAAIPKAEIISEEKYAVYGTGDKRIEVSSSFLSEVNEAATYAKFLYQKDGMQSYPVEENSAWVQFLKLVPTAKPGQNYSNPQIFEGTLEIEQVTHTIDLDAATAITEISGALI
jgi:hypothetical protein